MLSLSLALSLSVCVCVFALFVLMYVRQVADVRLAAGKPGGCLTTARGRDRPIEYDESSHKMGDVIAWIRRHVVLLCKLYYGHKGLLLHRSCTALVAAWTGLHGGMLGSGMCCMVCAAWFVLHAVTQACATCLEFTSRAQRQKTRARTHGGPRTALRQTSAGAAGTSNESSAAAAAFWRALASVCSLVPGTWTLGAWHVPVLQDARCTFSLFECNARPRPLRTRLCSSAESRTLAQC